MFRRVAGRSSAVKKTQIGIIRHLDLRLSSARPAPGGALQPEPRRQLHPHTTTREDSGRCGGREDGTPSQSARMRRFPAIWLERARSVGGIGLGVSVTASEGSYGQAVVPAVVPEGPGGLA